jgi:hypothetical protein
MNKFFAFLRPFGKRSRVGMACAAALGLALAGGAALALPLHGPLGGWAARLARMIAIPGMEGQANPQQMRIQQRFSIRISPGAPNAPQGMIFEMEQEERTARIEERRMGRCLPIAAIGSVQSGQRNRLVFFLRDSRLVVASLEKSCRAHDFYSGFYVEPNADGQLCIARDQIHSRSGASCTILDMRALVETAGRR